MVSHPKDRFSHDAAHLFQIARKKEKKLFLIAQEVVSSERVFVDVLRLLNVVSVPVVKCSHTSLHHRLLAQ